MAKLKEKNKEERIELRVKPSQKKLIENAASLSGLSTSSFMLNHALIAARTELDIIHKIKLSDRDRDVFMSVMKKNQPPNKALKNAVRNFRKKYS